MSVVVEVCWLERSESRWRTKENEAETRPFYMKKKIRVRHFYNNHGGPIMVLYQRYTLERWGFAECSVIVNLVQHRAVRKVNTGTDILMSAQELGRPRHCLSRDTTNPYVLYNAYAQ